MVEKGIQHQQHDGSILSEIDADLYMKDYIHNSTRYFDNSLFLYNLQNESKRFKKNYISNIYRDKI